MRYIVLGIVLLIVAIGATLYLLYFDPANQGLIGGPG